MAYKQDIDKWKGVYTKNVRVKGRVKTCDKKPKCIRNVTSSLNDALCAQNHNQLRFVVTLNNIIEIVRNISTILVATV